MAGLSKDMRATMQQHVTDNMTISDKVRALHAAGFAKADIARFIERRYQQVYNILNAPGMAAGSRASRRTGLADSAGDKAGADAARPDWNWVQVGAGGKIGLPHSALAALGAEPGETLQVCVEADGTVLLRNRAMALKALQEDVARYVPEGIDLAAELIAERRAEAGAEGEDG